MDLYALCLAALLTDPLPNLSLSALLPDEPTAKAALEWNLAFDLQLHRIHLVWRREDTLDLIRLNSKQSVFWRKVAWFHYPKLHDARAEREILREIIELIGWQNFIRQRWPMPIAVEP